MFAGLGIYDEIDWAVANICHRLSEQRRLPAWSLKSSHMTSRNKWGSGTGSTVLPRRLGRQKIMRLSRRKMWTGSSGFGRRLAMQLQISVLSFLQYVFHHLHVSQCLEIYLYHLYNSYGFKSSGQIDTCQMETLLPLLMSTDGLNVYTIVIYSIEDKLLLSWRLLLARLLW